MDEEIKPDIIKEEIEPDIIEEFLIEEIEPVVFTPEQAREEAAKYLAFLFGGGFLFLIFVPYLHLFLGMITSVEVMDIQKNISSILGGIIGSVIGYYYRTVQERR